jgi:serine/threonine protein kinase/predicted Zn-dependent protease
VALKVLRPDYFGDREHLLRFTREAKTAAQINHANVMSIFDLGDFKDEVSGQSLSYIVMEYIDGDSLGRFVADRKPDQTELLRLAEKIASALAAAHKLGIVHRDIKIDNIMVDSDHQPKILDFGLAKPTAAMFSGGKAEDDAETDTVSQELTQEGKIVGTVSYMSPEQARGEQVDRRSDIFSFGVVLYKMFTSAFPFEGKDRVSTIAKILEAPHQSIRQLDASLPGELERIVNKCLEKDPDNRYQDTRDLVLDIRNLRRQIDSGISDTVSSISSGRMDAVRARPRIIGLPRSAFFGILAVAVVVVLYLALDFTSKEKPFSLMAHENALAIFSFENKTGDSTLNWLQLGLPEMLQTDLAQNGTVKIISRDRIMDYLHQRGKGKSEQPDYQAGVKAAKALGAATMLSGSFFRLGEQIRIDARLEDVETGEILLGEKVMGDAALPLVDSLTVKISQSLNIRGKMADDRDIVNLTTSSSEAMREYTLGLEKMDGFEFEKAIEHFKEAVRIDTMFALAYLRLGMAYGFMGRFQEGAPYFFAAEKFNDRLSVKDKSVLNIFMDIWQYNNLDDAYSKIEVFVGNYPENKEIRTLYAVFKAVFSADTVLALAQLDTVLMLDPEYYLAAIQAAQIYFNMGEHERAIEYINRLKQYYPQSTDPIATLVSFYYNSNEYDKAETEALNLLNIDPGNQAALRILERIYIIRRDFDKAREYVNIMSQENADDPFGMLSYYGSLFNLNFWEGHFREGFDNLHQAVEQAHIYGDSFQITNAYDDLCQMYYELGFADSARYYNQKEYEYASRFQEIDYPIMLIRLDPGAEAEARPLFDEALQNFRAKIPEEYWPLADLLQRNFDALVAGDTAGLIDSYRAMMEDYDQTGNRTVELLGRLLIKTGQYEEGLKIFQKIFSGEDRTTRGFYYLRAKYYSGVAYESLGRVEEAVECYREVLKYWGKADIQFDVIKDARRRLDRLRG